MKRITWHQAIQLTGAFLGPGYSTDDIRVAGYNRCRILKLILKNDCTFHAQQVACGKDWLECMCQVLPELAWREFDDKPGSWSAYLAELRRIRKSKQSGERNCSTDLRINDRSESGEDQ